ncbi:MAG: DUF262 domain-containing HNH endonuclease family protein [Pyrinomonadaceae bacterium MAG19_C2-C3]|nr:DUF262 domain-containing HNH endonuclease family protein [Pyrinomonadaceae bacterium MAG19_C2-C3]
MAKHNLLDTDTVSINDLFTNGRIYRVPQYQRDYSWKEEHWDDLWTDIVSIESEDRPHYMGAIVLQQQRDKSFSIIDGQQRIATLSIIILAAIKNIQDLIDSDIEAEANTQRIRLLRERYVGSKDAASLRYSSKLFLNENNDGFYQNYLLQLRPPINPTRLTATEKLLWNAFNYFYGKIKNHFSTQASGERIASFVTDWTAERLVFIQIVVEDELKAYTVFETLNARGIDLTVTDLLKNYLLALSAQSPVDQRQAQVQWNKIIQITDLDEFPKFLRYYWNSRNELVRKGNLFKAVRGSIKTANESFALLDALERMAAVYVALDDPNDELWSGSREIRKLIREIKLFRVTQCYPLLLNVYERFETAEFEKVLRLCSVISFRYNVISGLNPNEQEGVYNRAARKVFDGTLSNAAQVAHELKDIYPDDAAFGNAFAAKSINTNRSKKLVRYVLFALENQIAASGAGRDYEEESATVEHILPENPTGEWAENFSDDQQPNFIYRIGNLTLLEANKNRDCERKMYSEKLSIYKTSQYAMTNSIDYPDWTPTQVKSRQDKLARYAKAIWHI